MLFRRRQLARLAQQRTTLEQAARQFMLERDPVAPDRLPALLDLACATLLQRFPRSDVDELAEVVMRTWSEVEGERTDAFFDLASSSRHLIWVVDPIGGVRRPVPVTDLLRILGPRVAGDGPAAAAG